MTTRRFSEINWSLWKPVERATLLFVIKDGKVLEKRKISLPSEVREVMSCPNPNCATNQLDAKRHFVLEDRSTVTYRCRYCERSTTVNPDNLRYS